eukprot:COSAG02_NODE_3954_length_5988_cov_32.465104_5_plen_334_part_00
MDMDVPLAGAAGDRVGASTGRVGGLGSSGSAAVAAAAASSGSSSCSEDDEVVRRLRRKRSPSSDISELSEPSNAAEAVGSDSNSNGDAEWPSAELDELGDLPTLSYADDVLPNSQLDRIWSEQAATAAPLLPAAPPPQPQSQAPRSDTAQDEKDDKRRRNREAAVRFRKNKKARESKLHTELASLRQRDEGWRKREEEWKQREAVLQQEKAALQTQLEQFKQLFSKKNLASGISATLCVCMAVVCVVLPVHMGPGGSHGHTAGGQNAGASPTGRSLLSIEATDAAAVDDGPLRSAAGAGAMFLQALGWEFGWLDAIWSPWPLRDFRGWVGSLH